MLELPTLTTKHRAREKRGERKAPKKRPQGEKVSKEVFPAVANDRKALLDYDVGVYRLTERALLGLLVF